MDLTVSYCTQRRDLEERNWNLVDRLAVLTDRLMRLVGVDHGEFDLTKAMCVDARHAIVIAREDLIEHRANHGC